MFSVEHRRKVWMETAAIMKRQKRILLCVKDEEIQKKENGKKIFVTSPQNHGVCRCQQMTDDDYVMQK